jgi:hypothetical protein
MTIQIAGNKALRDTWVTYKLSWSGPVFLTPEEVVSARPFLKKAGFDASQEPVISTATVKTAKIDKNSFGALNRYFRQTTEGTPGKPLTQAEFLDLVERGEISPIFPEGECVASAKSLRAAGVKLRPDTTSCDIDGTFCVKTFADDPAPVHCSGKISILKWNLRRLDGADVQVKDAGRIRLAIRESGVLRELKSGLRPVGLQPGVTQFSEKSDPIVPPIGYALAGVAMITLAANLRPSKDALV